MFGIANSFIGNYVGYGDLMSLKLTSRYELIFGFIYSYPWCYYWAFYIIGPFCWLPR